MTSIDASYFAQGRSAVVPRRSGAKVVRTADQTGIVTATNTAISWQAARFDDDGFWALAPNPTRLTMPRVGRYLISASVMWDANAGASRRDLFLLLNGVTRLAGGTLPSAVANCTQFVSDVFDLLAADFVEAFVFQDSGADRFLEATDFPDFVHMVVTAVP